MPGILFLVATPIGNLGDITPRVKTALLESQYILAEDTRVTQKILHHLGIKNRLISCNEQNEAQRRRLLQQVASENQSVSLVCDAGTPLVSDPGYLVVQSAISAEVKVVPIPGPSACITALIGSGLPTARFVFEGFLPDRLAALRRHLLDLKNESRTIVAYISPHKIEKCLVAILEIMGNRKACLARELTKLHEEFIRNDIGTILEIIRQRKVLGECVLVIQGKIDTRNEGQEDEDVLKEAVLDLLKQGKGVKEISRQCAQTFGCKSSKIYKLAVNLSESLGKDNHK